MSDEQDYAKLIEESLKDGSLGLKCRHCGESSWTYLDLYRRYQCQVCGNQEGRIRQDEYNVESQQTSVINEENIASESNKGNKNNQDAWIKTALCHRRLQDPETAIGIYKYLWLRRPKPRSTSLRGSGEGRFLKTSDL